MVEWNDVASRAASGATGQTGSTTGIFSSAAGSAFAAGGQAVPMVYLGKATREIYYPGSLTEANEQAGSARSRSVTSKDLITQDEAHQRFFDLDDEERAEWAQYLLKIGAIDQEDAWDFETLQGFWDKGVELSAAYTARGKEVDPRQALATFVGWDGSGESAASRARAAAAADSEPFTGSRTQRSTNINLSDPNSAKALANYVLSKALGREALPEELAAYREALNSYEQANPSVSTTTATYEDGIQTNQSTVTKGGATAAGSEQVLTDLAREEEDYAEYQAAGPIWNTVLAALQSPVQL